MITFAALHIVILVIFVVGGLAILVLYFIYRLFASEANLMSNFKTRPPQTLAAPVVITYHCDVQVGNRPIQPLRGAEVTFTVGGNSTVDGTMSKMVTTDVNGDANVTLAPAHTGSDELKVHVQAGSRGGDEDPIRYEVVKP